MFVYSPKALRTAWFEKSTDVCPVVRNGSGSPQRCGARWRGQGTIRKGFINSTEIVSAATTPRCSIEITCNQVNFLRNHKGTKSLDELLGDAFLLGVDVADMQGQHGKELLTEMRRVKEHLVKPIPVLLPRLDLASFALCHEGGSISH